MTGDDPVSRKAAEQSTGTDPAESENHQADSENPLDDILNKTFIDSHDNMALADDGTLYMFSDDEGTGQLSWAVITDNVKTINKQPHSRPAPFYQTNDNKFLGYDYNSGGFDWDIEKVPHCQFGGVLDFWRSNSSEILAFFDNNEVRTIGPSMESIPYAEVPNGGISNVMSIWIQPAANLHDGPYLPRAEYLMIGQNGRIVADNWIEHLYEE